MVYLLSRSSGVFIVELEDGDDGAQHRRACVRRVPLQPDRAVVEASTSIWLRQDSVRAAVMWSFALTPEVTLRLKTNADTDSEIEPNYDFAVALARALEWDIPPLGGGER